MNGRTAVYSTTTTQTMTTQTFTTNTVAQLIQEHHETLTNNTDLIANMEVILTNLPAHTVNNHPRRPLPTRAPCLIGSILSPTHALLSGTRARTGTSTHTTLRSQSRMVGAESRMLAAEGEVTALRSMMAGLAEPSDSLFPVDNTATCSYPGATSSSPKILTDDGSVNIIACGGNITFETSTCSFNPCAVQHKLNEIDEKLSELGLQ